MGKLTDRATRFAGPGKHGDGMGLTLVVTQNGARSWMLRYQLLGKRRDMGLGRYPDVSLAAAREVAAAARALAARGIDPLKARHAERKAARPVPTFGDIAQEVIKHAKAKTQSSTTARQWDLQLGSRYSGPLLSRPVNEITTVDVAEVLKPVWHSKPETARHLYSKIRRVFQAARIRLRDENNIHFPNPALWEDLEALGFDYPSYRTRAHHPSLPYEQMSQFIEALRKEEKLAARQLEFMILTCVRTLPVLEMKWKDVDLAKALWTVPIEDLKDRKYRKAGFRVPLSSRAVQIIQDLKSTSKSEHVFTDEFGRKVVFNGMLRTIQHMNANGGNWIDTLQNKPAVPHGFRATFRTWAEECTEFQDHVMEEAMGHVVGSLVVRAYRRTDVLEKRRDLMELWCAHCEPNTRKVIRYAQPAKLLFFPSIPQNANRKAGS